jgi:Pvc16 N-terminal domain
MEDAMIRDLSETLRAILDDQRLADSFPELNAAQIVFDPPVESFNPAQTTINLFLYDIRENTQLRSNEPTLTRDNGNASILRPPLRVACSYLITAWPVGGTEPTLQEHHLLSQALLVLSRFPTIPGSYLQGKLVGQTPALPMMVAKSDGLKDPSEFWTALGNKLRPSITATVTISLDVADPKAEEAPLVKTHEIRLEGRAA